jgi:hypothetical protein
MNEFSKIAKYKINTQKSITFLTEAINNQKWTQENYLTHNSIQKNRKWRNNAKKNVTLAHWKLKHCREKLKN